MDEKEIERKIEELRIQGYVIFGGILIFGSLSATWAALGPLGARAFSFFFVPIGLVICVYALFRTYKSMQKNKKEVKQ